MNAEAEIKKIEEEIARTQYNKATEHHIGLLKAKMARFKRAAASFKKAGSGKGFSVRKEGDATVVMVGFPSVGKSTLINQISAAKSEVAAWEFTTKEVIPGMLLHRGARIQALDIPGLIAGAAEGKGMGKMVLSTVRSADLILIITDVDTVGRIITIFDELEKADIRLDKTPADISIKKRPYGGISLMGKPGLTVETVQDVLKTLGIVNADIVIRKPITIDQLVDHIEGSCVYTPSIVVINKSDMFDAKRVKETENAIKSLYRKDVIAISAEDGTNIDLLKDRIYAKLKFIQVYTKRREDKAIGEPMIVKEGTTVGDICRRIHKDLLKKFKYALINGKSAKYPNQNVGLEHKLLDQDVVTIIAEI
jgi:hypothetical protein